MPEHAGNAASTSPTDAHFCQPRCADLLHRDITNEQIAAVFGVMAACEQHTFQLLTKRPERMLEWFEWVGKKRTATMRRERCCTMRFGGFYNDLYPDVDRMRIRTLPRSSLRSVLRSRDLAAAQRLDRGECRGSSSRRRTHSFAATNARCSALAQRRAVAGARRARPARHRLGCRRGRERTRSAAMQSIGWRRCRQCRLSHVPVFVKQLGAAYMDPANAVGGRSTKPVLSLARSAS